MYTSRTSFFFRTCFALFLGVFVSCSSEKGGERDATKTPVEVQQQLNALRKKAGKLYETNLDSTIILSKKIIQICEDNKLPLEIAGWKLMMGYFYRERGLYSVAESYYKQSLDQSLILGEKGLTAAAHEERGTNFLRDKKYLKALENMEAALEYWEELGNKYKVIDTYLDLSAYFYRKKKVEMTRKEFDTAFELFETYKNKDDYLRDRVFRARSDVLLLEERYQEAIQAYIDQNDPENSTNIGFIYRIWGDSTFKENPLQAKEYYLDSEKYLQLSFEEHYTKNASSRLNLDYYNLGGIKWRLGRYDKTFYQIAIDTLSKGILLSRANKERHRIPDMYRIMSEAYAGLQKPHKALAFQRKYQSLRDSLAEEENIRVTSLAEIHYETDRIEKEKIQEEQKRKLRENQLWLSLLLVVMAAGVGLFYYYRYRSKKELALQQQELMQKQQEISSRTVVDLIKENTINILDSKLEGQEQERERISRELHDNLGGTLSAVKLSLEGLEEDIPLELREKYIHTHKLLQQATQETRTLSHEMKALPLQNLGLDDSLKSLCETLNVSGKLEGHFSSLNPNNAVIKQQFQLHLYRICQELIQNVIKHAKATQVFLQLSYDDEKLVLMMEDDGQGFDVSKTQNGLGMENIQNRVAQINGKLDFDSSIGNGTTVIIEVPTEPS